MKKVIVIALVAIFNLGIMSCASQSSFDSKIATSEKILTTLNNTSWTLKRIDIDNRDFIATDEQKEIVLGFQDNGYGTSNGCNAQGGEFNVEDNKIDFAAGMSTMRYCGEEMKHLIYDVPLGKVKSLQIKKDQLQLLDANNKVVATYIKKK